MDLLFFVPNRQSVCSQKYLNYAHSFTLSHQESGALKNEVSLTVFAFGFEKSPADCYYWYCRTKRDCRSGSRKEASLGAIAYPVLQMLIEDWKSGEWRWSLGSWAFRARRIIELTCVRSRYGSRQAKRRGWKSSWWCFALLSTSGFQPSFG